MRFMRSGVVVVHFCKKSYKMEKLRLTLKAGKKSQKNRGFDLIKKVDLPQ